MTGGGEVARKISRYTEAGDYPHVVASRDYHVDPGSHFSAEPDYARSWPPHCVAGPPAPTSTRTWTPAGSRRCSARARTRPQYSAFEGTDPGGTPLAYWLRQRGVTVVDVDRHRHRLLRPGHRHLGGAQQGFATRVLLDLTAGVVTTTREAIDAMRAAGVTVAGQAVMP